MTRKHLLRVRPYFVLGCAFLCLAFYAASPWAAVRAGVLAAPHAQQIALPLIIKQSALPVIANGGFEEVPNLDWAEASSNNAALIADFSLLPNSVQPHGGLYVSWLGGLPDEGSVLAQTVDIPANVGQLKLRYWYWIASEETNCTDDLAFVLAQSASTGAESTLGAHPLCRAHATGGWVRACVDVGEWSGHTTRFQFVAVLDGSRNSNFFLDDVSLASSCAEE